MASFESWTRLLFNDEDVASDVPFSCWGISILKGDVSNEILQMEEVCRRHRCAGHSFRRFVCPVWFDGRIQAQGEDQSFPSLPGARSGRLGKLWSSPCAWI